MRPSLCVAAALTVVALAGCASSPKAEFYTLSAEASSASVNRGAPVTVLVTSVSIPPLVDRPQIVLRDGTNHVSIDEFARWAEPLKSQVPRVFVADLSQLLSGSRVSTLPVGGDPATAWRVHIDVQSFDATLGEGVSVEALWSVSPPGKAAPITGRNRVTEPAGGTGYDALVAAWSRSLATVSRAIAAAINPGMSP